MAELCPPASSPSIGCPVPGNPPPTAGNFCRAGPSLLAVFLCPLHSIGLSGIHQGCTKLCYFIEINQTSTPRPRPLPLRETAPAPLVPKAGAQARVSWDLQEGGPTRPCAREQLCETRGAPAFG